jgi:hypothetical protein
MPASDGSKPIRQPVRWRRSSAVSANASEETKPGRWRQPGLNRRDFGTFKRLEVRREHGATTPLVQSRPLQNSEQSKEGTK